ncbi:DUF3566 domain-containing protein [Oerskovia flava]|uniref:DUF3566 domain-containing protein n=1 Tax=Oerskovia flava TaxID=2986422 RepID=UPI002240ACCC|nr:DUF3566 domain-containing protein [Oerskovia sp. JB1-3-2]
MKAAATALAAARSAAKKVQEPSAQSAPGAQQTGGQQNDDIDDQTVRRAPRAAAPDTAPQQMHYAGAGVSGTATAQPAAAEQAAAATATAPTAASGGPRRVRLAISRIDPWSVMKMSFLLAVAIGIMTVVASAVVWYVLDSMAVFVTIEGLVEEVVGPGSDVNIRQFVEFSRVISLATLIGVVNIVLITALSTIIAFLYNITASLVGGIHLTLTDD